MADVIDADERLAGAAQLAVVGGDRRLVGAPDQRLCLLRITKIAVEVTCLRGDVRVIRIDGQRALEAPLIKKINARQRSFGATWREAFKFALSKILNLGEDIEVTIRWAATQLINDFTGWQAINEKQRAGVPTRQCLLEAGYTEAEVDGWGYTEDKPWGNFGRPKFDLFGTVHNSPWGEDEIPGNNPPVNARPGNGGKPQDASNNATQQDSGTISESKAVKKGAV